MGCSDAIDCNHPLDRLDLSRGLRFAQVAREIWRELVGIEQFCGACLTNSTASGYMAARSPHTIARNQRSILKPLEIERILQLQNDEAP